MSLLQSRKAYAQWRVDAAVHQAFELAGGRGCAQALAELLLTVRAQTALLRPAAPGGRAAWHDPETYLRGLMALSEQSRHWIRAPDQWAAPAELVQPEQGEHRELFARLAEHLLARAPVPRFLTAVWLAHRDGEAQAHQRLYKHLALGNSVRGAALPLQLTRRMARFLDEVPHHLAVTAGLRWCQVRGMGGDDQLATTVARSQLGRSFENENYWIDLLRLLVELKRVRPGEVRLLIFYLSFRPEPIRRDDPPRNFARLMRRVRTWLGDGRGRSNYRPLTWPSSGIGGLKLTERREQHGRDREWTVRELRSRSELVAEGRELSHCVGAYGQVCARRQRSIFSLQCLTWLEGPRRQLTIQVNVPQRSIVTALGRANRRPEPEPRRVMEVWARREGLRIAEWV